MSILKIAGYILACVFVVFNATQLNPEELLASKSLTALIGIICALCAIVLLLILDSAQKIKFRLENKHQHPNEPVDSIDKN